MNKSPQCNQKQTESKQCKSEVEELHIYQNLETGHYCSTYIYIYIYIYESSQSKELDERTNL